MKEKFCSKAYLILSILAVAGISCSHNTPVREFSNTASASEELASLEKDMQAAEAEHLNILSPKNYQRALDATMHARSLIIQGESSKETLHQVAVGRAELENAQKVRGVVRESMNDVIIARSDAIHAGAASAYPKNLSELDLQFTELTKGIEKNKFDDVKEKRQNLQARYIDLEINSIKQHYSGPSKSILERAKSEGASEYAPRTLAAAERSVLDLEAAIVANRHDFTTIDRMSDASFKKAHHALTISRRAKSSDKNSPEDLLLKLEKEQGTVAIQQQETAALAEKNQELIAKQELDRKFEEARVQFSDSEAEVYKKGNSLLIRLKKLNFPSGQAVLKGDDFKLLAKVKKIVAEFGDSSVLIEGHTDSRGSKKINERLSYKRAVAVKEYLAQSSANEDIQYKTVGYGYQKPLITNKTEKGRAQNRRVDILISPNES